MREHQEQVLMSAASRVVEPAVPTGPAVGADPAVPTGPAVGADPVVPTEPAVGADPAVGAGAAPRPADPPAGGTLPLSSTAGFLPPTTPPPSPARVVDDGPGAPVPSDLDEPARLRAALLRLGRRLRAIDAGTGLTPAELAVLGAVARCGPIRPSELAEVEGLNPTMVSRLLTRLVEGDVLCRDEDPSDGRVALVRLTERGRELHRQLRAARAQALFEQMQLLPAEHRRAISDAVPALEALADLVDGRRT